VGWIAASGAALIAGAVYLGLAPAGTEPTSVSPTSPEPGPPPAELPASATLPPAVSAERPPAVDAPPPAVSAAPMSLERALAGGEELPRDLIRALLQGAFEFHLPRHKLSSDDYEQLTDAVVRIRAARREMAELTVSVENAERLRELRETLVDALSDFEYVADLSPAEFTELVQPGVGITDDSDGEASDEGVPLEYLEDRRARE
jgi:hypothetical protein